MPNGQNQGVLRSHAIVGLATTVLVVLFVLYTPLVRADSEVVHDRQATSQASDSTKPSDMGWMQVAKDIVVILNLPVLAVAGITIYIAWQQHKTAKSQYRLNLYGKRFAVFEAARSFLQDIHAASYERVEKFSLAVAEAEFLFGRDVVGFLEEMRTKGLDLAYKDRSLYPPNGSHGLAVGEERERVAREKADLTAWFREQRVQLTNPFRKYLQCKE